MATKKILYIDADDIIGAMYARKLKVAGYDVSWVKNGNEGLISARENHFDLIILDIYIPERHGLDILQSLSNQKQDLLQGTKVIILTNIEQTDESRNIIKKVADAYLIKAETTPIRLISILKQI